MLPIDHCTINRTSIALGLANLALPSRAESGAYPTRPIQFIVGFPAGGVANSISRIVATAMAARLGQPVVVDNLSGAGGVIGANAIAKAAPDGYTRLPAISRTPNDDAIVVARPTARRSLSLGLGIGSRLPAYCSAMGRVLLAGLPPQEVSERVRAMKRVPLTPQTVCSVPKVLELVTRCREVGYASNEGELELGVRSMAVPLRDRQGQVVAAMSIAVGMERMSMVEFREAFLPMLLRARDTLARRLFGG